MVTDVVLYEEQNGPPNVVGSTSTSDTGVTGLDNFQRCLHGFELSRGLGSNVIVVNAVVNQNDSFLVAFLYEMHFL